MTSRQIVQQTIDFGSPERLAFDYFAYGRRYTDIVTAYLDWDYPFDRQCWTKGDYEYYLDPFGNTWHRLCSDQSTKGEVHKGFLQDSWNKLDQFEMPRLSEGANVDSVRALFESHPDHFRVGCLYWGSFMVLDFLRGFVNLMEDLILEVERVRVVCSLVENELVKAVEYYAANGADGIHIMEDWGSQNSAFISRKMWENIFAPGYRKICQTAHRHDMRVILHSCGMNRELIPGFIESGIDVLQFDQTANYRTQNEEDGIERLADEFGGKATFFCPIDIQHTLVTRDRSRIDDEARRMINLLGRRRNGFIAKSYGRGAQVYLDSINVDTKINNYAFECFKRHGEELFGCQFDIPELSPTNPV